MFSAVVAILGHAVDHWTEFDAYCLMRGGGVDPLELPSRRLCSAAWAWLTEGMDPETIDKLVYQLFDDAYHEPTTRSVASSEEGAVTLSPKEKWRAPPGWKPPGWNDEQGMRAAKEFMGFQATGGGR